MESKTSIDRLIAEARNEPVPNINVVDGVLRDPRVQRLQANLVCEVDSDRPLWVMSLLSVAAALVTAVFAWQAIATTDPVADMLSPLSVLLR